MMLAGAILAAGPAMTGCHKANAASMTNLNTGVAVIMAAGTRAAQIRQLRHVPSVGAVRLDSRPGHNLLRDSSLPDPREFRIAASRHAAGIARLQAALTANPVTRRALERRGIAINRVVGVRIGTNGSLRLYLL